MITAIPVLFKSFLSMTKYYCIWTEFGTLAHISRREALVLLRRLRKFPELKSFEHRVNWLFLDEFTVVYIEKKK